MSLVEKALEKLRASSTVESGAVKAATRLPTDGRQSNVGSADAGAHVTGGQLTGRPLRLDQAALTAAGILAPEAEAVQAASEYRSIKRSILSGAPGERGPAARDSRVVAVTSAYPGDGKTHTSVNLALSVARERDHVAVLIDADVAKGDVSRLLGLAQEPGLLDALAFDDIDVCSLLRPTDVGNLWVLPTGRRSELSTELLGGHRLARICARILASLPGAVLLLDSPPALLTSEAQVISSVAGQVLLVVKAGVTPQQGVIDAVASLGGPGRVKLVLNQAEIPVVYGYSYGNYGG